MCRIPTPANKCRQGAFGIERKSKNGHHYDLPSANLPSLLVLTGRLLQADGDGSTATGNDEEYLQLLEQEVRAQIDYFYDCQKAQA